MSSQEGESTQKRRRPKRTRPGGTRIALSDDERAEVYAAKAVLVGADAGLRELLLGLIRGNAHEMADQRRVADLASALAVARSVTADVRDLRVVIQDVEQRLARIAMEPDLAREHRDELRDALAAADRALARVDRLAGATEAAVRPALEAVSKAIQGILEAHDALVRRGAR